MRGTLRRGKKSSPTPLWEHCLPETALARSARGLDNDNDPVHTVCVENQTALSTLSPLLSFRPLSPLLSHIRLAGKGLSWETFASTQTLEPDSGLNIVRTLIFNRPESDLTQDVGLLMASGLLIWIFIFPLSHLVDFSAAAASTVRLTKCCPLGKALILPDSPRKTLRTSDQIPKCHPSSKPAHLHNNSSSFEVLRINHLPSLCSQGSPRYDLVEKIFHDGFVRLNGVERPYDCVDHVLEKGDEEVRQEREGRRQFAALTCAGSASCPRGRRCIEKCCKEGQLLAEKEDRSKPKCIPGFPLWRPDEGEGGDDIVRNSIFYKLKNLEVCYTNSSQYSITQDGTLVSKLSNTSTRRYCVDFLQEEEEGGKVKEVVLTQPRLCAASDDTTKDKEEGEEETERNGFDAKALYIVCAILSLACLTITFLIYWLIPSYNHLAGKIVLINVVFTALLSGFLLLFFFVAPSTFHLRCAQTGNKACLFIRSYSCPLIGYLGFFTFIGAFAWMTVMGLDLCWRFFTSEGRDHTTGSRLCLKKECWKLCLLRFGFLLQLSIGPGLPSTLLLLLLLQHLFDWPSLPSPARVALATLLSCSLWLLLLLQNLAWTLSRPDAPTLTSENSKLRIFCSLGLGLPLLSTVILALIHILSPANPTQNPGVGHTRCFVDHQSTLLLLHLPLSVLAFVNLLMFLILVRKLFSARQNAAARSILTLFPPGSNRAFRGSVISKGKVSCSSSTLRSQIVSKLSEIS